MSSAPLIQLYPAPQTETALEQLYLHHVTGLESADPCPCVYTNFITSLDGRIAVEHADRQGRQVPDAITNDRDWRLYQELAAQADVLLVSARYIRQLAEGRAQDVLPLSGEAAYADLHRWRIDHGLSPQPAVAVLSSSLKLPLQTLAQINDRAVYVCTGEQADRDAVAAIEQTGAKVLYVGSGKQVEGEALINALVAEGFRRIYSIAGPGVLETLLSAGVLDRLYLTQVHRLIGGNSFDTLLEGGLVSPPADFKLNALYFDAPSEQQPGQFFAVYDSARFIERNG